MCIRDRASADQSIEVYLGNVKQWHYLLFVPIGFLVTAVIQSSFVTIATVSYTHLRAHETVLDLVCRLLLEKKQTYLTTNTTISLIQYNVTQ